MYGVVIYCIQAVCRFYIVAITVIVCTLEMDLHLFLILI